ncbi:MAG: polymer-forming cytoskeletal protein [Oscillospiraceae bacterium]|nr:polymer-forming cytoskeletal protein [Oscillospiraceae bacterium]
MKGNINSTKIVHVDNGVIEGMIDVGEIDIDNGKIKGDIVSNGAVNVDNLSLIIGDVRGQDIICDGKIKGDLYVENSCTINANAVIFGNIKAAVINIDSGAVIKGTIEVVRQSIASTNLFDFEEQFMDMSDFAKTSIE